MSDYYTGDEEKRIEALKKKIKDLEKQRIHYSDKDYMWRCCVENCVVDGKIDKHKEEISRIDWSAGWRAKYGW